MISFIMNASNTPTTAPVVVKLGGAAMDESADSDALWSALADLHANEPGGVVLVHGGGVEIDRKLARLGFTTERREGIRITPPEQMDEIVGVLAGSMNKLATGKLMRLGVPAVGLCLSDGQTAHCRKTTKYSFDAGRVGQIVGGDPSLITSLLKTGFMPVLCSIGLDESGEALNINADEAAGAIAAVLGARELILLTDVDGVLDEHGVPMKRLAAEQIPAMIASGAIHDGMIPKVRGALEAAGAAGSPAVIASWKRPGELASLARGYGVGTWVTPPAGAQVQARAGALAFGAA